MKTIVLSFILFIFLTPCLHSQYIAEVEYFFDSDPGQGNAIQIPATDGSFNSTIE